MTDSEKIARWLGWSIHEYVITIQDKGFAETILPVLVERGYMPKLCGTTSKKGIWSFYIFGTSYRCDYEAVLQPTISQAIVSAVLVLIEKEKGNE